MAQDVYRRRLAVVAVDGVDKPETPSHAIGSLTVGDQWPLILEVLNKHLETDAELLDRLLVDLANLRPPNLRAASRVVSNR